MSQTPRRAQKLGGHNGDRRDDECVTMMSRAMAPGVGYETFAGWLRDRRQATHLSLRDLGTRADVDFTYLSKIEARKVPPPADEVVRRLAAALDERDDGALMLAEQERRLPIRTIRAVLRVYPELAALIERLAQEMDAAAPPEAR